MMPHSRPRSGAANRPGKPARRVYTPSHRTTPMHSVSPFHAALHNKIDCPYLRPVSDGVNPVFLRLHTP